VLIHVEAYGAYAGMPASAVPLADFGEIDRRGTGAQGFDPTETFIRNVLLLNPRYRWTPVADNKAQTCCSLRDPDR
jgi:hypothetical protein